MLTAGTRIARYEVLGFLGAGGMGEVYRARDLALDRLVAIKTIRHADTRNPDSRLRFDQERRLAATLEHPHICRILDAGATGDVDYIVMEFLEGDTLARRLAAGPLPIRELVRYAIEIASALHYAHGRGIVHRDLKPANVFLTRTGVKLLDFGLATSVSVAPLSRESDSASVPATAQMALTAEGTIVGTAQYLAPERLEGQKADHRSDLWAFGLVMYEMASGKRAFDGPSPARQIAAILNEEPAALDPSVPNSAELEWLIRQCLQKDPDQRWQSAGDVATLLRRIVARAPALAPGSPAPAWQRHAWSYAAVSSAVLLGAAALLSTRGDDSPAAPAPVAFEVAPPLGTGFTPTEGSIQTAQLALSPDGRWLAFVADAEDGQSQLWIRSLDSVVSRPLSGTSGATFPFWSPDSRSLGFFAHGVLKRVDLTGTPAQMLAPAPNGRGGAWNPDGVILFAPNTNVALHRVDAAGGSSSASPLTSFDDERADTSHRWPQFLADGRQFVCFVRSNDRLREGIYLGAIDRPGLQMLVQASYGAIVAAPNHLLYVADSALISRRIDAARGKLTGTASLVAEDVGSSSNFYTAASVSHTGLLAFARNATVAELAWVDRSGSRISTLAPAGRYVDFQVSADGMRAAVAAVDAGAESSDIRIFASDRPSARLTAGRATDASPVWSPDGNWLVFRSNRDRVHDLYKRPAAGPAAEEPFVKMGSGSYPTDWSADGQTIVYHTHATGETGWDIWAAPWNSPSARRPLLRTPFNEVQGQLSRDGQWLAYTSNESGKWEVYVHSLAAPQDRLQVSRGGGSDPEWGSDGRELCYVNHEGWLACAPFGGTLANMEPVPLFRAPGWHHVAPYLSSYEIGADGQRFLLRIPVESARTAPLQLRANWTLFTPPAR